MVWSQSVTVPVPLGLKIDDGGEELDRKKLDVQEQLEYLD